MFELANFEADHKLFSEATIWTEKTASAMDESMPMFQNTQWDVIPLHRNHRTAFFDDIDGCFKNCGIPCHTDDPLSSTVYARNVIRSAWEEWIFRWRSILHDDIEEDHAKHGNSSPEEKVNAYQELMNNALWVKEDRQRLRGIIWAFRCEDEDYRRDQVREMHNQENKNTPSRFSHVSKAMEAYKLESRTWAALQEKLDLGEQDICQHMDMYAQRAALQQAMEAAKQTYEANNQTKEANRMARSSGQLTKIATVIVPCSFVASIFSMGDEFAAGKSLFYVYWLISMPITAVLLFWVMCGNRVVQSWNAAKEHRKWLRIRIFLAEFFSRSDSPPDVEKANWAKVKKSA